MYVHLGMWRGGGISSAPLTQPPPLPLQLPPNKQCLDPYTPTYLAVASRAGGDDDGRVLRPLGGICNQEEEEELRNVGERTGAREEWGSSRATLSLKL